MGIVVLGNNSTNRKVGVKHWVILNLEAGCLLCGDPLRWDYSGISYTSTHNPHAACLFGTI